MLSFFCLEKANKNIREYKDQGCAAEFDLGNTHFLVTHYRVYLCAFRSDSLIPSA